jgi:hypothetical protein
MSLHVSAAELGLARASWMGEGAAVQAAGVLGPVGG